MLTLTTPRGTIEVEVSEEGKSLILTDVDRDGGICGCTSVAAKQIARFLIDPTVEYKVVMDLSKAKAII